MGYKKMKRTGYNVALLDDLENLLYKIREELSDEDENKYINPMIDWCQSYEFES